MNNFDHENPEMGKKKTRQKILLSIERKMKKHQISLHMS